MKLDELPIRTIGKTQNRALMRLLLRVQAETHRLLRAFFVDAVATIRRHVDDEGLVDGVALLVAMPGLERRFRAVMTEWGQLFERGRVEAASIPFGGLVVSHNHYFGSVEAVERKSERAVERGNGETKERKSERALERSTALPLSRSNASPLFRSNASPLEERTIDAADTDAVVRLWQARRQRALEAGAQRIQGDGLQLSQRIWRLENDGLERIRSTLSLAMAERTSAVKLAALLEPVLGAGKDCPRWSEERLYKMTAGERTTSKAGLFSGEECQGQGIAYNALRLARTELQNAHHAMTSEIYSNSPWVTGKFVRLSPSHPRSDICDQYAAGGPYAADEQILSLHPNCLCYYEAAVMKTDQFRGQVRGWLDGENDFLDRYEAWSGFSPTQLLPWSLGVADALELWLSQGADAHAEVLGI